MAEADALFRPSQSATFKKLSKMSSARRFREWLPNSTKELLQSPNASEALLLAEYCSLWREWHAAAELYVLTLVLGAQDAQSAPTPGIVAGAGEIVLLVRKVDPKISSFGDFVTYCCVRLRESLSKAGVERTEHLTWAQDAFGSTLEHLNFSQSLLQCCEDALLDTKQTLSEARAPQVGYAREIVASALQADYQRDARSWGLPLLLLHGVAFVLACAAVSFFAAAMRGIVAYPAASRLFDNDMSNILGAVLLAWPLLLVCTWIFAWREAVRTRTYDRISALFVGDKFRISAGQIVPFKRDWYFHVYQFVWIPILLICLRVFSQFSDLQDTLEKRQDKIWANSDTSGETLDRFLAAIQPHLDIVPIAGPGYLAQFRHVLTSDWLAITVAGIAFFYTLWNQRRVQRRRIEKMVGLHWWDRRINPVEWRVRVAMLCIDHTLLAFLMVKVVAIATVTYMLITSNNLKLDYFAPDGVAGLRFIADIFFTLAWLVIMYGALVFASVYVHWNHAEYRGSDFVLLTIYCVLFALIMTPLAALERRIGAEEVQVLAGLAAHAPKLDGSDPVAMTNHLRNLAAVRDWPVSAIGIGAFRSPTLIMLLQAAVLIGGYLYRIRFNRQDVATAPSVSPTATGLTDAT
jgi:hypothetical protein